jgi:hypothetical protein
MYGISNRKILYHNGISNISIVNGHKSISITHSKYNNVVKKEHPRPKYLKLPSHLNRFPTFMFQYAVICKTHTHTNKKWSFYHT